MTRILGFLIPLLGGLRTGRYQGISYYATARVCVSICFCVFLGGSSFHISFNAWLFKVVLGEVGLSLEEDCLGIDHWTSIIKLLA